MPKISVEGGASHGTAPVSAEMGEYVTVRRLINILADLGITVDHTGTAAEEGPRVTGLDQTFLTNSSAASTYLSKSAATATYARLGQGRRYVGLGDSVTEAAPGTGFYDLACMLSGGKMYNAFNAGNAGEGSAAILARFDTDVTPYAPDVVVIEMGINDLDDGDYDRSVTVGRIDQAITKTREIGAIPVVCGSPPNNTQRAKVMLFNRAVANLCAARRVRYVDLYTGLVDPTNGQFRSGYGDGVHPDSKNGAPVAARALLDACDGLTVGTPFLAAENADSANLLTNGLFLDDTNADGLANSWSIVNNVAGFTRAIVTSDSAIKGNWQQVTMTGVTSNYQTIQGSTNTGFAVGDRLLISARIKTSGLTNSAAWRAGYITGSGNTYNNVVQDSQAVLSDGIVFEKEITVASGTTWIGLFIQLRAGGSSSDGVLQVAQAGIYNLTTAGSLT